MTIEAFHADLIKKLGEKNFRRIRSVKVGIAGAGGLGSNCALNLVRSGFCRLRIADFDAVDPSNLDRQFYFSDQVGADKVSALKANLLRVCQDIEVDAVKKKIGKDNVEEMFGGCDIVAECLDTAECKTALLEKLLQMGKTVVAVSGLGGIGSSDDIKVHRLKDNLVIIGDLKSDICQRPALSPRVNIAAAKQADVILEYAIK
jgi:sulfur carrier protein ThiS adenylyltransferase